MTKKNTDLLNFSDFDECAVSNVEASPLSCIIVGATHSGKSSTCGTFSSKTVLYITTPSEVHGFRNAVKMNGEYVSRKAGRTPSRFIHVNLGVVQELDRRLQAPYTDELAIGEIIPSELQAMKLWFTLEAFKQVKGVDVVVVDSLSNLYDVFVDSIECKRACTSDKGSYNSFREFQVVGNLYSRLSTILDTYNSQGSITVCTCVAKLDGFKETPAGVVATTFHPELPSVNVARTLLARFETTIFQFRTPTYKDNLPHFAFNIRGAKTSRARDDITKIVNSFDVDLRCQFLKLGYALNRLPADLDNLKVNVEGVMRMADQNAKQEGEGAKSIIESA